MLSISIFINPTYSVSWFSPFIFYYFFPFDMQIIWGGGCVTGQIYDSIYLYILCSLQTRLRPLPVQTLGMQLLKLFIQFYYINSHQQYENVTIEVSHSSMFKNHNSCKSYYVQNRTFKTVRQLGQLYCNWL